MPQVLALLLFECLVSGIGNAKGSVIGSTSMPRDLSLTSFLGYLIARLRAIVQLVTGLRAIMPWGSIQRFVFRLLGCVQSCSAFGFWALVEMALIMKKYEKNYASVIK